MSSNVSIVNEERELIMSSLKYYTERAKTMPSDVLRFHIKDIYKAWDANSEWREPSHPYGAKLWAEWDAYVVELNKRGD